MEKKRNYIFLFIIILIILLGDLTLIRTEKDGSTNENRTFQKFEHLTLNSYFDGTYQKKLENAMSDQFIGGESIKLKLKGLLKFFDYNNIHKSICKGKYVNLNSYYSFDCDDSLLSGYQTMDEETLERINNRIEVYNKLNNYIDTYYYFLSTAAVYNFEKNDYSIDLPKLLEENLSGNYKLSSLIFNNYEDYTKYFYKTDHHWNHVGTQKAYEDIIAMIRPRDNVLKPTEEVEFEDTIFYGSAARISQIFDFKENFKVYKYDYPNMKVIIDKKYDTYGNYDEYYSGNVSNEKLANHYGIFYGGDPAEVVFEANKSKYNLLILGSSFTNSVNKLVASHFNKTYDVDLRHYENLTNEVFDIKEYIEKNNIDKVLIIMDYNFLIDQEFDMEWRD